MIPAEILRFRQSLPLELKVKYSERRIRDWYDQHDGRVCVSFSGGKDSTALLHLVRNIYPEVPAVYVDTGLEFPEIRSFVKTIENVVWLRPEMGFKEVLEKHGYPVVSKKQAQYIRELRHTKSDNMRRLRVTGIRKDGSFSPMAMVSKKWHYLVNAPFEISERCCDVMKKKPFDRYHAESGLVPYVGTMASEGGNREKTYLRFGCNTYSAKRPQSKPLSFWREEDIWAYIRGNDISYSPIYDMGYARTGCVFCAFGAHLEKTPNRFQRLKTTHPKLWEYCMRETGLNMHSVLEYCGIESGHREFSIQQEFFISPRWQNPHRHQAHTHTR